MLPAARNGRIRSGHDGSCDRFGVSAFGCRPAAAACRAGLQRYVPADPVASGPRHPGFPPPPGKCYGPGHVPSGPCMTAPFPAASLAADVDAPLVLAVPKGRILEECGPLLDRVGVRPANDYLDEDSRRLRFPTNDASLDVVRVRPFDVATFVAFGAAQIGICGADVLMEFDYSEIYAPLDLGIGRCRVSVAEPAETAFTDDKRSWSRVRVATKYPNIARRHYAASGI